mgnify:CR=1 FL=1
MTDTSKKEPLLFLCHRIPFPPNKGDKIRSFNILKKLSATYDIYLGFFIDDPYDKQYVKTLNKYCREVFHLDQNKTISKIKGLTSFLTNKPITLPYYFDKRMQYWVNRTLLKNEISKIFVYSSSMAQYCESKSFNTFKRVIDFVDVDSDKWRQYAEKSSAISKWIYQREYKHLAKYEDYVCRNFDYSLFVSPQEAKLFADRQPIEYRNKVLGVLNGVDLTFFDTNNEFEPEPLPEDEVFISFTGAMDYWANVEAVEWFVDAIWPAIKAHFPQLKFYVVGGNPSKEIKALNNKNGVVVTGRVKDIRPYIDKAQCVVASMQIARGIQNKVLEAMAMSKTIVMTSLAAEGILLPKNQEKYIANDPALFAEKVIELLNEISVANQIGDENRTWVEEHYRWNNVLNTLPELLRN